MFAFFKKTKEGTTPQEPSIDGEILDAHLCSIKICLLELMNYKKKRFAPSPTHVYWRPVDIEAAWLSVKELLSSAFRILCRVSTELNVTHNSVFQEASFHEALQTVINLIDQIDQRIQNTAETEQHSGEQLHHIDDEILQVQHIANRINKYVTKEFKYST